ncbi:hypothetical protein T484DRAFT_1792922 [Baffinella frigidus]|nr:hypothetical protein T484DRAFT_1792922 [Cryptophyta sp. CCMP2293]
MLVLLENPERNLHVCNFGWARFRGGDVALIAKYSPLVEMGGGSGWLAYLLREKGAEVDCFDQQLGGTFVSGWHAWPWSSQGTTRVPFLDEGHRWCWALFLDRPA